MLSQGLLRAAARCVVGLFVVSLLGACGQDASSQKAAETSLTDASTSPSATASPGTDAPPEGEHGVTFSITNWSRFADDPVVLAWKKTVEAFYGSVNAREPNRDFLRRTAKDQRRLWVGNINYAREHDLVGAAEPQGRVVSVQVNGKKAILMACDLRQSTNFRPRGEAYQGSERGWKQMRNTFELKGDLWVMTESAPRGRCPKGTE